MTRVVTALSLMAIASCVVRVDYGDTQFLCSDGETCPDGFSCSGGMCIPVAGSDAGAGGFAFTRQLTFDNAGRGELVGFTALVVLDELRFDYSTVSPDGSDIQFRDSDGTVLPHEIELWDPAATSYIWVRVPSIDADSTADSIFMDYGAADATDSQAPTEVWSDYQAVYHLREDLVDSTAQGFDGVNAGTAAIDGIIGPARSFDGVDDYIDLGADRPFVRNAAGFTLDMWVNPAPAPANNLVAFCSSVDAMGVPTNVSRAQIIVQAGLQVEGNARTLEDGATPAVISPETIPTEAWTWIALVADFPADTLTLYIDGARSLSTNMHGFGPTSADSVSTQSAIGVDDTLAGGEFAGAIDAVHLRLDAQDADWVSAQHASMTDAMITFGPQEQL